MNAYGMTKSNSSRLGLALGSIMLATLAGGFGGLRGAARAQAAAAGAGAPGSPAKSSRPASFQLKAEASFEERRNARGGWDHTIVEPRYALVQVERPPLRGVELLLAQRLVSTSHSDAEESESEISVTAWLSAKSRFDERVWSFTDAADDGAPLSERELFVATKHGCCGAEDVHDLYSLRSGKLVATATTEAIAYVAIPNTPTARVLAYHGVNGHHGPLPRGTMSTMPQLLGVLTLGSHDGVMHRIAVTAQGVEPWTPQVRLELGKEKEGTTSLDLWAADKNPSPRGITGFRVVLLYEGRPNVAIPVEADDFDLAHAVAPPPFHLQRIDDRH